MERKIVCIDGLIGAGKSTLIHRLSNRFHCYPEPIAEWNLLSHFYETPKVYKFPFQLQVLISQFKQRQSFANDLVLVERCPWTSRHIFAPLLLDEWELKLYDQIYQKFTYSVDYFIYLEVDPLVALRRIRARSTPDRNIPSSYLRELLDRYTSEMKMSLSNVYVVDAEKEIHEIESDIIKIISLISQNE